MRTATLGSLCEVMHSGFAYGKKNLVSDGLPHLRPFNVGKRGQLEMDEVYRVPLEAAPHGKSELRPGDILFNNTNSPDLVGKSAVATTAMSAGFSNHITRLRLVEGDCDPGYVAAFLYRLWRAGFFKDQCNQWVSQAAFGPSALRELKIPLPPLEEQRRIVDILNRAASIERLRATASTHLRDFIPALFTRMFGDQFEIGQSYPSTQLKELAAIGSGVTKGRKLKDAETVDVPYLRVANVQDGYLNLDEIKTIAIKEPERDKYALQAGDLVLTEGGDPDKLGRGALWEEQLPYCAHQNHVFRVRPDTSVVTSEYLKAVVGSAYGKAYFLSVAKQTTGIASINKTQLGQFPVPVPPMDLQVRFTQLVNAATEKAELAARADAMARDLSASLIDKLLGDHGG
ncbi:restriction endonuclease subunit S [Mesobacterium pallidum]|uniref:restriction endonuclease subunit S n=1 Tax=Mesobacterium pallidum TaxID=2872037 RepID=UPI001EE18B9A|nr:restriction endonuclease subunit S [Mesobacterium pallidum]